MSINLFFRCFFRYLLIFLMFFLSIGALFGGYMLISDPSGASLHLPAGTLTGSPFTNFTIPGIILLFSLGILPLFLIYPLIFLPDWPRANLFNLYSERHWAWTYSLYVGIILVIWIDFQIFLIGGGSRIQFIYALLGIGIVITALLPSNIRFYSKMKDME